MNLINFIKSNMLTSFFSTDLSRLLTLSHQFGADFYIAIMAGAICAPTSRRINPTSTTTTSTTTSNPQDLESEFMDVDEFNPDAILARLDGDMKINLAILSEGAISREALKQTLYRLLDILEHRPQRENRRGPNLNIIAKAIGRVLLQDSRFGSSSDEVELELPRDNLRSSKADPNFAPERYTFGRNRVTQANERCP